MEAGPERRPAHSSGGRDGLGEGVTTGEGEGRPGWPDRAGEGAGRGVACTGADGAREGVGGPTDGVGDGAVTGGAVTGGDPAGGPVNTCDTRRTTDAAVPLGAWDAATRVNEPRTTTARQNPAATSPAEWSHRRRGASAAQRDCRANGLGPVHDDDPCLTSSRMS
jgi:hypothetical protein